MHNQQHNLRHRLTRKLYQFMPNRKVKPNFYVIGAGKSGTTSLYQVLRQHPDVFLADKKESNFHLCVGTQLSDYSKSDQSWLKNATFKSHDYFKQFRRVVDEKAVGEICPMYIYHPMAAKNIARFSPTAKIIAVLRHPIDCAYSGYLMHVRNNLEKRSFIEAVLQDQTNPIGLYADYQGKSDYAALLNRYQELFKEVKIFIYEEAFTEPAVFLGQLLSYLDVRSLPEALTMPVHNAAPIKQPLSIGVQQSLLSWSQAITYDVEGMLGRPIPAWRQRNLQIERSDD